MPALSPTMTEGTLAKWRKAEVVLQEKMKNVTGGLPLPPGLKLF